MSLWVSRPEALEKHKRGCLPSGPIGRDLPEGQFAGIDHTKVKGKPKGYTCYLCGRDFGSKR